MLIARPVSPSEPDAELPANSSATLAGLPIAAVDSGAFEEIVREHSSRLFAFVFQMTRQRQDAEDVVQQTFIKAYKNLHRFDGSRPIINWLLTIARRSALNHFRSAKKWDEMPESAASTDPSPAIKAQNREENENVWNTARRLLSPREYEVLWLRFGEELSVAETARVAGLTQTHVKVIVYRARKQLMKGHAQ